VAEPRLAVLGEEDEPRGWSGGMQLRAGVGKEGQVGWEWRGVGTA
jgi:hypothetical protein